MIAKRPTKEQIQNMILEKFRDDKICPNCHGPVEKNRVGTCILCELKIRIRHHCDIIINSANSMHIEIGTLPNRPVHRQIQKKRPKKRSIKKTTKKKVTRKKK